MEHSHGLGDHNVCCNSNKNVDVRQSFVEMEFERGIWYAAQYNELDRVKALMNKGVSANVVDSAGYTALHYAARNGHYEVCKMLLENGAAVNAQTPCGHAAALHRAAMQGHIDIVKLLLKFGANANLKDIDGYTALHKALAAGSVSVSKFLIMYTDLTLMTNNQLSVEQLAKEKCPDIVQFLSKYINTENVT
nr:ankyrin repeat domain-containing protein 39 [Megalopta genalis]XP_033338850.1 ankyrin repeat domain-containing protein 39 [Megalopta genalis]